MFYIQTQEGELPYVYKTYKTIKNARRAIAAFLDKNKQAGAVAIVTACHETCHYFYRQEAYGRIVEETPQTIDAALPYYIETEHGYSVTA